MYISGDGLARGYLNRPELTAEKFIRNLLAINQSHSTRLGIYLHLPDGNIEFLGRIDHQVKIGASGLNWERSRRYCVNILAGDRSHSQRGRTRHKRLVAYVVPHQGESPATVRDLRRFPIENPIYVPSVV